MEMNSVYNHVSSIDEHADHTPSKEGENIIQTGYEPRASAAQLSREKYNHESMQSDSGNEQGYDQDSSVCQSNDNGYDQDSITSNNDEEYDQDSSKSNDKYLRHQILVLQNEIKVLNAENIALKSQLSSSQELDQSAKCIMKKLRARVQDNAEIAQKHFDDATKLKARIASINSKCEDDAEKTKSLLAEIRKLSQEIEHLKQS